MIYQRNHIFITSEHILDEKNKLDMEILNYLRLVQVLASRKILQNLSYFSKANLS